MKTICELNRSLNALAKQDPLIKEVRMITGDVPWRGGQSGVEGLARIIVGQQLSVASAKAIWHRFEKLWPERTPEALQALDESAMRASGLSRGKIRTLHTLAKALSEGLELEPLQSAEPEQARALLTSIKGIGPWTADIYMMFCAGHPDCFAPGDLALRKAVSSALLREKTMSEKELSEISQRWSPYRTAAAWLFWAYFRAKKAREGVAV